MTKRAMIKIYKTTKVRSGPDSAFLSLSLIIRKRADLVFRSIDISQSGSAIGIPDLRVGFFPLGVHTRTRYAGIEVHD